MPREYETNIELNPENVARIKDWGERIFAEACIKKGLKVRHQIPVGTSTIDFQVTNPNTSGEGVLVEVTAESPVALKKDKRKKRQEERMEETGLRHTTLSLFNLKKIKKHNDVG